MWLDEPRVVKKVIKDYFHKQFRRKSCAKAVILSDFFVTKLDQRERALLTSPFTEEEVQRAVWDCGN